MKKTTLTASMLLAVVLFAARMAQAQGTLYVSNIVGVRTGGQAFIASDSWVAELMETGNDSSGYILNSVQLTTLTPTGSPSGLNISIYSDVSGNPSSDLGSASGLTLLPSTEYFVVATAATLLAQGSYSWREGVGTPAPGIDQWMIDTTSFQSTDQGSDWTAYPSGTDFQMAIYATAIPEPSTWVLCLVGGGFAFYVHARKQPTLQAKLN